MDTTVALGLADENVTSSIVVGPPRPPFPGWRPGMWLLPFPIPKDVSIVALVFGTIINSCGLLGNVAIIGGIITSKKLRKTYNVFIGSLAVNDLLSIIFSSMFQMMAYGERTWPFNYALCVFHYFAFTQFNFGTVLHILAITAYRYIVVVHPAAGRRVSTKTFVITAVCCLHMAPFVIIFLPKANYLDRYLFVPQIAMCLPAYGVPGVAPVYIFAAFACLVVVCLFLSHLRIHHVIRVTENRLQHGDPSSGAASSNTKVARQKKHVKVLKCMLVVFVLFSVSYFPLVSLIMVEGVIIEHYKLMIVLCLSWMSSGTNWIVYGVLDRDFRAAYRRFILFCCPSNRVASIQSQSVSGSTTQNTGTQNGYMPTKQTMQTHM